MRKVISQREARRLRKRVDELESLENKRFSSWVSDYPTGRIIGTTAVLHDTTIAQVKTARRLRHAVVAIETPDNRLTLYALMREGQ